MLFNVVHIRARVGTMVYKRGRLTSWLNLGCLRLLICSVAHPWSHLVNFVSLGANVPSQLKYFGLNAWIWRLILYTYTGGWMCLSKSVRSCTMYFYLAFISSSIHPLHCCILTSHLRRTIWHKGTHRCTHTHTHAVGGRVSNVIWTWVVPRLHAVVWH